MHTTVWTDRRLKTTVERKDRRTVKAEGACMRVRAELELLIIPVRSENDFGIVDNGPVV